MFNFVYSSVRLSMVGFWIVWHQQSVCWVDLNRYHGREPYQGLLSLQDMVNTRVGFVLSSNVVVRDVSFWFFVGKFFCLGLLILHHLRHVINMYSIFYFPDLLNVFGNVGSSWFSGYVHLTSGYQGIDTIRPSDNGALCGGGAFETKGCAENDCSVSQVNNGGSEPW